MWFVGSISVTAAVDRRKIASKKTGIEVEDQDTLHRPVKAVDLCGDS